jgi:hypothetical protein
VKSKLVILTLLAAAAAFAQFSVGIRIGAPPPPRVVHVQPRSPGPGYTFIAGYWYPSGNKYKWHDGYWTRPAYSNAHWVAPRYEGQQYYNGYWDGDRGGVKHDHGWDKKPKGTRDYDRDHHDDHHE